MKIDPIDQHIRELCDKLITAEGEELDKLLAELRIALHDHMQGIRLTLLKTVTRFPKNDSDSKAAN